MIPVGVPVPTSTGIVAKVSFFMCGEHAVRDWYDSSGRPSANFDWNCSQSQFLHVWWRPNLGQLAPESHSNDFVGSEAMLLHFHQLCTRGSRLLPLQPPLVCWQLRQQIQSLGLPCSH